ncbi:helix-turn-helix domain-containing protein [Microtetraspora malaysiensis]|uniref:helix-turn-helix domain-containing protein n=1 Tax=Microtetraspora malaysiensis TaxID=161358 RepID=UPI003D94BA78
MPHPPSSPLTHNGEAIRTIRKLRNITMKELSGTVGITPQSLSNAENERKRVSWELLNKIALALDVPLAAISRTFVANGRPPVAAADYLREDEAAA